MAVRAFRVVTTEQEDREREEIAKRTGKLVPICQIDIHPASPTEEERTKAVVEKVLNEVRKEAKPPRLLKGNQRKRRCSR